MAVRPRTPHARASDVVRPLRRRYAENSTATAALISERAGVDSAGVAILDGRSGHTVTWTDVEAAADRWWQIRFAGLSEQREVSDVRVGLLMSSSTDFSREYLAALAAGVTVAPLDAASSEAELQWSSAILGLTHVMRDGGDLGAPRNVAAHGARARPNERRRPPLASGDYPLELDGLPGALSGGRGGRAWHPSVAPLDTPFPAAAEIERPAVVSATKGSTGAPKLVPFTERQLLAAAANIVNHFRLRCNDRGYLATSLIGVDSQVIGLLAMLLAGGSLVVTDGFDPGSFWAGVERSEATWLNVAPAMVTALAGVPGPDREARDRLRFARVGGEAVPLADHSKFWQSTGVTLVEAYTLTETAGQVAANPLDPADRRPGSAGLTVGHEIRIVDGEGHLLPCDTTGCIQVRGATVATQYLSYGRNRFSLPAREADGWLDTGDLGYRTRDGYLYLVDVQLQAEAERRRETTGGAAERSSQVACGTPASPLRAAAFRP
jgi:oxalate---CoA ligase